MMDKKVEYSIISGFPIDVIPTIKHSLLCFMSKYKDVKIGITGRNPQDRFNEHIKDGWERMIVKYETSSENFANRIESYFISSLPKLKNIWMGTSHIKKEGKNYVYFILKKKII